MVTVSTDGVKECTEMLRENWKGKTSDKDNNVKSKSANIYFICMQR